MPITDKSKEIEKEISSFIIKFVSTLQKGLFPTCRSISRRDQLVNLGLQSEVVSLATLKPMMKNVKSEDKLNTVMISGKT